MDAIAVVAFSANGQLLASGGIDGRICVWEVRRGKLLYVFSGKSAVLSLLWLESSNDRLVCGMADGTIAALAIFTVCVVFHSRPRSFLNILKDLIRLDGFWAHQFPVERLAISGSYLASGAHEEVKIWSYASAGELMGLVDTLQADSYSRRMDGGG